MSLYTLSSTMIANRLRARAGALNRLGVAVIALVGLILWGASGCQPAASDCAADSDCPAEQTCATGGGLLVSGGVCVWRSGAQLGDTDITPPDSGPDAGRDARNDIDPNCEPHTCAELGDACGSFDDGCGGVVQCGEVGCIASIAAGPQHTCAARRDGSIYCWGANEGGQLGSGDFDPRTTPQPVLMSSVHVKARAVSAGSQHSCALDANGTAWCWGSNELRGTSNCYGQLGTGDDCATLPRTNRPAIPVSRVHIQPPVVSLQTYQNLNCMRDSAGQVYCWGDGSHGQVGDQQGFAVNETPVPVQGLNDAALAVGLSQCYACALQPGALVCWGDYDEGCAGDGQPDHAEVVFDEFTFDSSRCAGENGCIAGGRNHTCFVDAEGKLFCFNDNQFGQLGVDPATPTSPTPLEVNGLPGTVRQIAAGDDFTCALQADGAVFCWGHNAAGQLGDGTREDSFTPVQVALASSANLIAAGASHACAALDSGAVQCWGANAQGQLGNAESGSNLVASTPVDVAGF